MTLLPSLFENLINPSTPALRHKAALTFGSLAAHCVHSPIQALAEQTTQASSIIAPLIERAFKAGGAEASWGATVLASVIAIVGWRIFSAKRLLKCIMTSMDAGLNAKKELGLKLISRAVWAMLVWAWEDGHSIGLEGFGVDEDACVMMRQAKPGPDRRAATIAQPALLNHPVGVASVAACVGDGSDQQSVQVGIQLVDKMLQHQIPHHVDLFFRLLSTFESGKQQADEPPFTWDYHKLMCSTILRGGALYSSEADTKNHTTVARVILANNCIKPTDIRPLDAEEVRTHWDALMDCWDTVLREGTQTSSLSMGVSIYSCSAATHSDHLFRRKPSKTYGSAS